MKWIPIASFRVHAIPVAQARARVTRWSTYDPPKSKSWKALVRLKASEVMVECDPYAGYARLSVHVYRNVPKSWSKKKQRAALEGVVRPGSKPDLDNYLKGVKDALKGIVLVDDAQVVEYGSVGKWYSERPGVQVIVEGVMT